MGICTYTRRCYQQMLRGVLRSAGVTIARLDYHKPDGCIYLTAMVNGRIRHFPLPSSEPMTADEICELLFADGLPAGRASDVAILAGSELPP